MRNDINLAKLSGREIGYLVGFYVGDGNIFIKKKSRKFIVIKNKTILLLSKCTLEISLMLYRQSLIKMA